MHPLRSRKFEGELLFFLQMANSGTGAGEASANPDNKKHSSLPPGSSMQKDKITAASVMGALLGQRLIDAGLIGEEQLGIALDKARTHGGFLGDTLVQLGFATSERVGRLLSQIINVPYVDLSVYAIDPEAVAMINESYARQNRVLPISKRPGQLIVAMTDPLNVSILDDLHLMTGLRIVPTLSLEVDIQGAFARAYDSRSSAEMVLREIEANAVEMEISTDELVTMAEDAPIVRLVNSVISGGVSAKASDIHIEPQRENVRVRYRVDGVLYEQMTVPSAHHPAVVSRIKIMSGLNIAERRRPQDGRLIFSENGPRYEMRVSTLPSIYGEKVVLRILDQTGIIVALDRLGFLPEQMENFEAFIRRPHGMILVTGPTGAGKSTTLYVGLNTINDSERNIVTIEDPVEYQLPGITQVSVNHRIDLTFATGLRSIVRQDPDVIMVGEIRDRETAEIAVQAALTGHLVFSTLHTNDAPGAIIRLENMGIEPFLISSSVLGVIGQRLLRLNCTHCLVDDAPNEGLIQLLEIRPDQLSRASLKRSKGCSRCSNRGYKGRIAAFEVMPMDSRLRRLVLTNADGTIIKRAAIESGMRTIRQSGVEHALSGLTTLQEVARTLISDTDKEEEVSVHEILSAA